jgi:hypothetical protein
MSTFTVTPAELDGAAGRLANIVGQLANVADVSAVNGAGAENPQVESAVTGFAGAWVTTMQEVSQALSIVTGNLGVSGSNYHGTDSAISGNIRG